MHKYVKDLRTPEELSDGALGLLRKIVVSLGILTGERAQASLLVKPWSTCLHVLLSVGVCFEKEPCLKWQKRQVPYLK